MGKVKYPFVIYPDAEGGYVAEIPALKGCLAQGETLSETLEELEVVENLWLETAVKSGLKLPKIELEIERVKQKLAA
jgi:predicted RNase H-like HicB family nuclease